MEDGREEVRYPDAGKYQLSWCGADGLTYSADGMGVDISASGAGLESPREVKPGSVVYIQAADGSIEGDSVVVHCTRRGLRYRLGLEFREKTERKENKAGSFNRVRTESEADYYDILQISPKAEMETVHRVFRIMAVRFHPDNPETGDVEEFLRLKHAYAVLSDPIRRAEYDGQREIHQNEPIPIFELKDFVTGVEAEANRRLGVLSLLYNRRRADPDHPGVSLLDLEKLMGFPREYLSFTMWYLRSKEFAVAGDNSDYCLTAAGADFVEVHAPNNEILTKLIKSGPARVPRAAKTANGKADTPNRAGTKFLESGRRADASAPQTR